MAAEPGAGVRRARLGLALGAAAGLALAIAELLASGAREAGPGENGAVAVVNGTPIRLEEYQRAVAALASDRRNPVGDAERSLVLERLIDEELLVQRGLALGLARHDGRVRRELVAAVIQSVVSEAAELEPTRPEVEAFFAANRDYFARSDRARVRRLVVRADAGRTAEEARARAELARRRLAGGEPFERVAAELGDAVLPELPDDLLTPTKLREYLGPSAARTAVGLAVGQPSEPVRTGAGFEVLWVLEREAAAAPALAEVEAEVRFELRRRAGDRALRAYLERLREEAEIRSAEVLP